MPTPRMRCLLPLLTLLALAGCGSPNHAGTKAATAPDSTLSALGPVPASWQPEAFLDSVGRLPAAPLVARATRYVDSVFIHQPMKGRALSATVVRQLKQAGRTGYLDLGTARRLLNDTSISLLSNPNEGEVLRKGLVRVRYVPFGADEYGLDVGMAGHPGAAMYFFKGNQLLARHATTYIYDQSLRHYRDAEGHTVVYYIYTFARGLGCWWHQYFFYRYEGDRLVPLLTELQNANQTGFDSMGARTFWLEASVQQTNPLTLKMVYFAAMPDTASTAPHLLDDSTLVTYRWNPQSRRLAGQFQQAKIARPQLLSYTAESNDLLFINAYYARLKQALADPARRPATRRYLWAVRQQVGRPQLDR